MSEERFCMTELLLKDHFSKEAFCEIDIVKFIISRDIESPRVTKEHRTSRIDWDMDGNK
jgi:hypothetical protein